MGNAPGIGAKPDRAESEGIHPAIREKLMGYLKDNKDATYAEAKKHIGEKIAGWKLSEEDFEEAKKSI